MNLNPIQKCSFSYRFSALIHVLSRSMVNQSKKSPLVSNGNMKVKSHAGDEALENVIYVGRIPRNFTEGALQKFVMQFGSVKNLVISRSPSTGGSRGYGFIQFECPEDAQAAIDELNGCFLQGKALVANHHKPTNTKIFFRPDQEKRKRSDKIRRLNGYISPPLKEHRSSRVEVIGALDKMIALEARTNEKNQSAGINYAFDGFSRQKAKC